MSTLQDGDDSAVTRTIWQLYFPGVPYHLDEHYVLPDDNNNDDDDDDNNDENNNIANDDDDDDNDDVIVPSKYRKKKNGTNKRRTKRSKNTKGLDNAEIVLRVDRKSKIEAIEEFLHWKESQRDLPPLVGELADEKSLCIEEPQRFFGDSAVMQQVVHSLQYEPEETIARIGYAAHRVLLCKDTAPKINVRILNYSVEISLKELKSHRVGQLVSVSGTVVRVSNIRPIITEMSFFCSKCDARQTLHLPDGKYMLPSRCRAPGCRSTHFQPDFHGAVTMDWQKIRIQENNDELQDAGRIPRIVEIEATKDLVDKCVPGDLITVCGVVKTISAEQHSNESGTGGRSKSLFFIYIAGNSISNNKKVDEGQVDTQFSIRDLEGIYAIAHEKELFHLIVNSICPQIWGNELVKAGLALCMFGGCHRFTSHRNRISVRGDPHMLIVGDPGLGKSQLLTAVSRCVPRGVYVCGNTTTSTGLTVTVIRDAVSGDYALEAGALVLADQGVCCIDEFDKMRSEHQALLEAMEQQSISIAKAGIVCNLPSRCSVIAAANPIGGHYNKGKTVSENLKINPALLSRFDLIFILLDKPDVIRDNLLTSHVVGLHANARFSTGGKKRRDNGMEFRPRGKGGLETWNDDFSPSPTSSSSSSSKPLPPIEDRLRVQYVQDFEPLPPRLLRKYIAYARKYVSPVLSEEAREVLKQCYVELRQQNTTRDMTPVTTRQLEALIRLAQARAKVELREVVTEQDALDVVEIMKNSMADVLSGADGMLDLTRSMDGGRRGSKKKNLNKLVQYLIGVADTKKDDPVFTFKELKDIARSSGMAATDMEAQDIINALNHDGFILMRGGGYVVAGSTSSSQTPKRATVRL